MKYILAMSLLLAANSAMANIIHKPTSRDCLQYTLYREARGESLVTMRAVADVVLNRSRKNKVTICETILEPGQFPYARHGIKKVTDKKFLTMFMNAYTMKPVLTDKNYLFFNTKKFKWCGKTRKVQKMYFCKLKEKNNGKH